jgi:hypothetical protein
MWSAFWRKWWPEENLTQRVVNFMAAKNGSALSLKSVTHHFSRIKRGK